MDVIGVLSSVKDKVLDAAHHDLLKGAYELQNENITQLRSNNEALKESNILLQEKVTEQKKEIKRLRVSVKELTAKLDALPDVGELSEEERKILQFLSSCEEDVSTEVIAQRLGLSLTRAKYYLEQMRQSDYVYSQDYTDGRSDYYIAQKGRGYLMQKGLI